MLSNARSSPAMMRLTTVAASRPPASKPTSAARVIDPLSGDNNALQVTHDSSIRRIGSRKTARLMATSLRGAIAIRSDSPLTSPEGRKAPTASNGTTSSAGASRWLSRRLPQPAEAHSPQAPPDTFSRRASRSSALKVARRLVTVRRQPA